MSLWDDYRADACFSQQYPHGVNNDEWRTKGGAVIKIKDMSEEHIRNCMRLLGRDDDFYYAFEAELKRRKEEKGI